MNSRLRGSLHRTRTVCTSSRSKFASNLHQTPWGQPIPIVAERERLVETSHDGIGFRQAAGVLALILGAELSEPLGAVFCGPDKGLDFSEPKLSAITSANSATGA